MLKGVIYWNNILTDIIGMKRGNYLKGSALIIKYNLNNIYPTNMCIATLPDFDNNWSFCKNSLESILHLFSHSVFLLSPGTHWNLLNINFEHKITYLSFDIKYTKILLIYYL